MPSLTDPRVIQFSEYRHYLLPRKKDWHKGLSGHVLVVGGAPGFSGAVQMAALAAYRVGAGLVSVATHPDHASCLNEDHPEIMVHAISNRDSLLPLLDKARVVVLGPGLGQTEWSKQLFEKTITSKLPMIVDADGLNLLANTPSTNEGWVLTPHPGEAARLLQMSNQDVQNDRIATVVALQKRYGGVTVLKGSGTLVADSSSIMICDKGNPGMATAGMGDILSGVIGGLAAQNIPLKDAAALGVYLHACAGDLAAKTGERGMIATDLLPYLRQLVNPD